MAHRSSKPLPPVPGGTAPAAQCSRSVLASALTERRQLISSGQSSRQDRPPQASPPQASPAARGAVSPPPPRHGAAVSPRHGAPAHPRPESTAYAKARGAVSPRHDPAVSPPAKGTVSPRHGPAAPPQRSPKDHRFSMPQPLPVLSGLPNKNRFSAMELREAPSPKTDRPLRQGPPPAAKLKPTAVAPKPKSPPARSTEPAARAPSTSPLQVAPKPKKPPVSAKTAVPAKPDRCKGALSGSRNSEDFSNRRDLPPVPVPFQLPVAAEPRRSPPTQFSPPAERYPSEDIYEAYNEEPGGDIYEAPIDEDAAPRPLRLSSSVPAVSSLYRPMNLPQPEVLSFGANGGGPSLFDGPTSNMSSSGVGSRGPERSVSRNSSHDKLPVSPPPPPKPSGKSAVSPQHVKKQPPPPAKKPKPKPAQAIQAELARLQCFSEPSSPQTHRSGAAAEKRHSALQGLKSSAVVAHGSVDSLSSLSTSDGQTRWSRPPTDNPRRPPLPVPAIPAGTRAAAPRTDDRCLSPPSVPRRTASNAGALVRRRESGFQEEFGSAERADSPRVVSPQESLGPLPKPPPGQECMRAGTPDSGMCRSSASPSDVVTPDSGVYDDVVIVTPHPEAAGPVRCPPGLEQQAGGGDGDEDLTYSDATEVAANVKRLRQDVAQSMPKRLVDRPGPRQSANFPPPSSTSPYQTPDRQPVSEEQYTHLHDAWSDAPGSTTDSFYELEDAELNELLSSYTDPADDNAAPQHAVDRHCRVATLKASRGYIVEASKGLDPPGNPPAELANNSNLRDSDLYSDNGRDVYPNFMKTGLNAVRFGKFPSYIQGRPPRLSMHRASIGEAPYIQLIIIHEEIYNNTLRLLVERFVKARDFSPDLPEDLRIIDKITAKTLYSNIEPLLEASTKLLSGLRRRLRSQNGDIATVSDLFNFMLSDSFNKLYLTYCTNFVYQKRKLDELHKDNSHFSRSLALAENDSSLCGHGLASLISVPMSYITYLPKYLQVLTENLPPQAVTVESKAAEAAKKVGGWCDEAAQTVSRTEQLVRTEHELDFAKVKHIALVSQSRRLIRAGTIKLLDVANPAALHRQDAQLLVFNDLVMLAKPRGLMSTIKLLRSDKTLKVIDWCERRRVDVETNEADLMDFPEQEKTMRGGISRLRTHVRKEAALDTSLAFKLMWDTDGELKEYLLEAYGTTDRARWLTALNNEASILGHAVESVYEDAEITHYEITTNYIAKETDELNLVLGNTVVSRRKAADGWCFGEDLLTGRAGWFLLLYCTPV